MKPQRLPFSIVGFKPQRGKFTPLTTSWMQWRLLVSNPNGVNLHATTSAIIFTTSPCFKPQRGKFTHQERQIKSRNLSSFKPQRGKFTHQVHYFFYSFRLVSNPNGVNLHPKQGIIPIRALGRFKPQRGKFTQTS